MGCALRGQSFQNHKPVVVQVVVFNGELAFFDKIVNSGQQSRGCFIFAFFSESDGIV
jgi:hypothetical protein